MFIRTETATDVEAISDVVTVALGPKEAQLAEALRSHHKIILSLVAVVNEQVVGYALFSPVVIETKDSASNAVGLGPLVVLPQLQRQGIGSTLVRSGLEELRKAIHTAVVVLGHPDYYPRFGFSPSVKYGIRSQYDVPDEVFMVRELVPGTLNGITGPVVYAPEFNEL